MKEKYIATYSSIPNKIAGVDLQALIAQALQYWIKKEPKSSANLQPIIDKAVQKSLTEDEIKRFSQVIINHANIIKQEADFFAGIASGLSQTTNID